jgi:hypothetical protein
MQVIKTLGLLQNLRPFKLNGMARSQVADGGDGFQRWRVAVNVLVLIPCSVGPCHSGMARPQVADGGDGFQMWRVAVNILVLIPCSVGPCHNGMCVRGLRMEETVYICGE